MRGRLLTIAVAAAAVTAACSSSGHSGGSTGSSGSTGAGGTTGSSGSVTVTVKGGRLTAPNGKTLYYNTVDTAATIGCTGSCAAIWPPLLGQPTAGSGVDQSKLGTASRPGGGQQVTYYAHPLYEYSGDSGPGSAAGSGLADGGGRWVVATPGASAGSSSSSSSTSGGGGGGYGGY